jgi:hypothetical protein
MADTWTSSWIPVKSSTLLTLWPWFHRRVLSCLSASDMLHCLNWDIPGPMSWSDFPNLRMLRTTRQAMTEWTTPANLPHKGELEAGFHERNALTLTAPKRWSNSMKGVNDGIYLVTRKFNLLVGWSWWMCLLVLDLQSWFEPPHSITTKNHALNK